MDDNKYWSVFWLSIMLTILGILGMLLMYNYNQDRMMVEAGLQERHYDYPTYTTTVWQRDCK